MIFELKVGSEATALQKTIKIDKFTQKEITMLKYPKLDSYNLFTNPIFSEVTEKDSSALEFDIYGRYKLVKSDINATDLLAISFKYSHEKITAVVVCNKNADMLRYDSRNNAFNAILAFRPHENINGDILEIATVQQNSSKQKKVLYRIAKEGDILYCREVQYPNIPTKSKLNFLHIEYSVVLFKESFSKIDETIVNFIRTKMTPGFIRIVKSKEELITAIVKYNIKTAVLVDQSGNETEKQNNIEYLKQNSIDVFDCVCYTTGKKEFIQK